MTPEDVIAIAIQTIDAMVRISMPMLLTSLVVGLVITIIQALTQIQDPNLQFTPKILASFAILLLTLPYMANDLHKISTSLFTKLVQIGMN